MSNYIRTAPKISGNRFYVYKFLVQIIISWYIERHSYKTQWRSCPLVLHLNHML